MAENTLPNQKKGNNGTLSYIKANRLQVTMQVFALSVLVLNLWLASKLAPITEDLALLGQRVEAIERVDKNFVPRNEIELQLKDINRRLGNIERSLGVSASQ